MFEKSKTGDDSVAAQDAVPSEPTKAYGSSGSGNTERGKDVAVIGSSIQINGDLRGDEDLRIEGDVSGTVKLKNSELTIGKSGKVKAGVYAKSIAVDGETKGDLHATECVSIHANACVQGNIIAPRVSIVEGAHFKGSIEMDPEAVEQALGKPTTRTSAKSIKAEEAADAADATPPLKEPPKNAGKSASRQARSA